MICFHYYSIFLHFVSVCNLCSIFIKGTTNIWFHQTQCNFFWRNNELNFFKLVFLIVTNMGEIIKIRKKKSTFVNIQNVKITFFLFQCQRLIDNSIGFDISILLTKNSVVKFQNLVANHKSQFMKLNPDHYHPI